MGTPCEIRSDERNPWLRQIKTPAEYDIRLWLPPEPKKSKFETNPEADGRHIDRVRLLLNGEEDHKEIAQSMERCQPFDPCGLIFHPHCARRYRINLVRRAAEAITTHFPDESLHFLTITPAGGKVALGELADSYSYKNFNGMIRQNLIRAGLGDLRFVGGACTVFNEDSEKEWDSHWLHHVHLIVVGTLTDRHVENLRERFPKSPTITRTVDVEDVPDLLGALSYSYKGAFFRRVSYIDEKGHRNVHPRRLPIKDKHLRELARFLSTQKFSERLFLRGFRRRRHKLIPE